MQPSRRLLIEGGGDKLPKIALQKFCEWCKDYAIARGFEKERSYVVIIPWASSRTQSEIYDEYSSESMFGGTNGIAVRIAPGTNELLLDRGLWSELRRTLSDCCMGVFIAGGDQNRITDLFDAVDGIKEYLRDIYNSGLPFAGTSAGASVMSASMLTGEGATDPDGGHNEETICWNFIQAGRVGVRSGLGLVVNMVIDQHFVVRHRSNRLLSVMLTPAITEDFGLGIDEDVAVLLTNEQQLEVIGAPDKVAVLYQRLSNTAPSKKGNCTSFLTHLLHASLSVGENVINLKELELSPCFK